MKENIVCLKKEFEKIKNMGLVRSLRNGCTGVGYTFEKLLLKEEDKLSIPDYKGIEIKTKLGYSKTPIALFNLTPKIKDEIYSTHYLLNNYGYPDKTDNNFKSLVCDVYSQKDNIVSNKYVFKTFVDYDTNKVRLLIFNKYDKLLDSSIYWDFDDIKNRLYTKLLYMAHICAYPYKINNETYYKYVKMDLYKLKDFKTFLRLLDDDEIIITFTIRMFKNGLRKGQVHDHGTSFKLNTNSIDKLFDKIYY